MSESFEEMLHRQDLEAEEWERDQARWRREDRLTDYSADRPDLAAKLADLEDRLADLGGRMAVERRLAEARARLAGDLLSMPIGGDRS